jgi:hypothetical protein
MDQVSKPGGITGNLAIRANVAALPQLAGLAVQVTGSKMDTLNQLFPRSGDSVSGTLQVPAGPARVFYVSALDSLGDTTHTGGDTVDIKPGLNPQLFIALHPRPGQVPITIVIDQPDSTPPDTTTKPSGSLYSGYSTVSPHWPHIRTMMTDFYYGWTSSERAWAAAHYDYEMSGDGAAWQALNPNVQTFPYALLWTTLIPTTTDKPNITGTYSEDMRTWYSTHPKYQMETAFLHDTGAVSDSAHRFILPIWSSNRWFINVADSGLVAYDQDRFSRVAVGATGGVFIDESGTGDMSRATGSKEYPTPAGWPPTGPYITAYAALVQKIHQAIYPKKLMLNTSGYMFDGDLAAATAAGAVHLEKDNNPLSSNATGTWAWIDKLLANGVFVDLVNAYDMSDAVKLPSKNGYGTDSLDAYHQLKMWELASYYMVVQKDPSTVALQLVNMWDRPYSTLWIKAQEANIGHPTALRVQARNSGTDPAGNGVVIYTRDFDRALIAIRPQTGWGTQVYGPTTAIPFALPPGETWLPLRWDGTLGAPVTSVSLQNATAQILIKGSTIQ